VKEGLRPDSLPDVSSPEPREESTIMTRRLVYRVCVLTVFLGAVATVACTKLDSTSDKLTGPLAFKRAGSASAIPEEFGTLISVSQPRPEWSVLWFQKPDRSIVAVYVNVEEGRIHEKGLTIPRK
jgi:hypothetical protein